MKKAGRRDLGDVLTHGHRTVKNDTKVTNTIRRL